MIYHTNIPTYLKRYNMPYITTASAPPEDPATIHTAGQTQTPLFSGHPATRVAWFRPGGSGLGLSWVVPQFSSAARRHIQWPWRRIRLILPILLPSDAFTVRTLLLIGGPSLLCLLPPSHLVGGLFPVLSLRLVGAQEMLGSN